MTARGPNGFPDCGVREEPSSRARLLSGESGGREEEKVPIRSIWFPMKGPSPTGEGADTSPAGGDSAARRAAARRGASAREAAAHGAVACRASAHEEAAREAAARGAEVREEAGHRAAHRDAADRTTGRRAPGPVPARSRADGAPRQSAAGADRGAPPMSPLPDLTGVALRGLRILDDERVTRAVDETLRRPGELAETWYSSGAQGGRHGAAGSGRT